MSIIHSSNKPCYVYDPSAGSNFESGATGGSALGTSIATVGGLGSTANMAYREHTVDANGNHEYKQVWDKRVMLTAGMTVVAGAASGAAALSQVAGPGGAIAAAGLGLLTQSAKGYFDRADSQKCKAALRDISDALMTEIVLTQEFDLDPDLMVVLNVLEYSTGQQKKKGRKGLANLSVVGQPLKVMWNLGAGAIKLAKHTKGLTREQNAQAIVEIAKKPTGKAGEFARAIIQSIVAKNYEDILASAVSNAMKTG